MSEGTGQGSGQRSVGTGAGALDPTPSLGFDDTLPVAGTPQGDFGSSTRSGSMGGSTQGSSGSQSMSGSGSQSMSGSGGNSGADDGHGGSSGSGATDKVTAGLDTGMSKAAEGLDRVVETVRSRTEGMGDNQLTSAAKVAADRMESGAEALRSMNSDEMVTNLESMIRQKPLESLLVAAGIGFILSRAL